MTYTLTTVMANVRAMVPNITTSQYSDARLTILVGNALRRLNVASPHRKTEVVDGTDVKWYGLASALDAWVEGTSVIKHIAAPAPVQADDDPIDWLPPDQYRVFNNGTADQLYLNESLRTGDHAVVEYTTPWLVSGLEGAATTTLLAAMQDALEMMGAALLCFALAAEAAGRVASTVPGDMINWRSMEADYRRSGQNWETEFEKRLGLNGKGSQVAAASVRRTYGTSMQNGGSRLTHRSG